MNCDSVPVGKSIRELVILSLVTLFFLFGTGEEVCRCHLLFQTDSRDFFQPGDAPGSQVTNRYFCRDVCKETYMNNMLRSVFILLLVTLVMPAAVLSADNTAAGSVTTGDPEIAEDELQLRLKPLLRAELKVEADAWLQLLEDKVSEISTAEIAVNYKQHEIESAENIEAALDKLEEANSKAADAADAEAAQQLVQEVEQALAEAKAEAKTAVERMASDEESNRVIAIAAQQAEERSAAEGVEAAADEPESAAGTGGEAPQTGTDATREELDETVTRKNEERTNLLAYLTELRG
jgi:small conductance mechanosensitive channel